MVSTYLNYNLVSRDLQKSMIKISQQADVSKDSAYYKANIGKVTSVDDLLNDHRLYTYAMKAYGLEVMAYAKAFIRKVLTEGTDDKDAFANQLSDSRYASLVKSLNFAAYGAAATSFDGAQKGVVDRFQRQTLEIEAGEENMGVRLALYFERMAPTIKSGMEILADDALSEVVRTAVQMPDEIIGADIDRQAEFIEDAVDIEDFQDPTKVGKFLERFTAMWELENPAAVDNTLNLFTSSSNGISTDLLISINNLKLGGR